MLIGLTGRIASGKGEIVEYLKKKGFEYITISKIIREEAAKIKIPITRESLQDLGDLIRKHEGGNGWVKRMIERIDLKKNFIIDGIRNPGEVEELKKLIGFVLVSVDAPQKIRFERIISRNKPSDPKIWEEFVKVDGRDFLDLENPLGQQVGKCMALANFHVVNDSTREEFERKIEEIYAKIIQISH
ncbi:AAA family ATPase [Candidatus Pacearchaeota archaeon]|nr:AAA family ATPase [Candidatus Pacearchaeota archaeon]